MKSWEMRSKASWEMKDRRQQALQLFDECGLPVTEAGGYRKISEDNLQGAIDNLDQRGWELWLRVQNTYDDFHWTHFTPEARIDNGWK